MGTDHSKFAVFILSHGRPGNVQTWDRMRRSGYTGAMYLLIDNEDAAGDEYRASFGADHVIVFDKAAAEGTFDVGDTHTDRRAVVYARNAIYGIAKGMGLDYFLELDDDYNWFRHSWLDEGAAAYRSGLIPPEHVHSLFVGRMDQVIEAMLTFLDDTDAATVAFSQGGDHVGAGRMRRRRGLLRKAMNAFFLRTDRPVEFLGRINEDATAYVVHGARGDLFLTVLALQLNQIPTQQNSGGLTDIYLDRGTYVKSFYTVMMAPSCVTVQEVVSVGGRYHHKISWDHAVPKILGPQHRKVGS